MSNLPKLFEEFTQACVDIEIHEMSSLVCLLCQFVLLYYLLRCGMVILIVWLFKVLGYFACISSC